MESECLRLSSYSDINDSTARVSCYFIWKRIDEWFRLQIIYWLTHNYGCQAIRTNEEVIENFIFQPGGYLKSIKSQKSEYTLLKKILDFCSTLFCSEHYCTFHTVTSLSFCMCKPNFVLQSNFLWLKATLKKTTSSLEGPLTAFWRCR